ncbi:MAG: NUDIX domain-containing protein [Candidatus Omnitrophica bacterium]|nr:NUDIX domain-containing protein [Candidatus Omnitrophota bacterium]MDD5488419.1 NUDIX domain-containing protein [Candidatus Omnitrophota bacterium]
MKEHFAAGGVVIKKERGRPRVLLIKDRYGRWTWPKGHLEKGETPETAALREIKEETGLEDITIETFIGRQEYHYILRGEKVHKVVDIYLVRSSARQKLVPQKGEVEKAEWFWPEEAVSRIEYAGSAELVANGIKAFKERFC